MTVTATLAAAGVGWADPLADGWVFVSATEATFTVTPEMSADPCARVSPLAPVVTPSTCASGVVTLAVLTPQGPAEVVYSFDPAGVVGAGGAVSFDTSEVTSVTVTATLVSPNTNGWSQLLAGGWVVVADDLTRATLTVPLTAGTCEATQPAVTFNPPQCVNGLALTASVTPVAVDGVTYDPAAGRAVDVELGETLTVTATLAAAGVGWADPLADGWVFVSATEATFTVTPEMSADPCARVSPLAPVVTPSTCASGVVTLAVLTPQGPAEVVYSFDPAGVVGAGGAVSFDTSEVTSVIVTATLVSPNTNGWSQLLVGGWVVVADDLTRATLTVPLTAGTCKATQPAVTFNPPQCVNGLALTASVTPVAVDGVTYDPAAGRAVDVELGETVTVTATLAAAGVGWADPLADGWVFVSATEATFTVTPEMSADPCARVSPLAPVVTPATCASGVVTLAVLTPQGPAEVVYSFDPAGVVGAGGAVSFDTSEVTSVTVTATLVSPNTNGWSQLLTGGWVVVADDVTRATLTVPLTAGTCEATQPAVTFKPPQCVNGLALTASVTPVAVDGVTYDPAAGGRSMSSWVRR